MCGICGIINLDLSVSAEHRSTRVRAMNDAIQHRGPDGEGFLESENATLAMRRLAIIDMESGDQPIYTTDGKIGIVFNGEIYNYKSLRELLQKEGVSFDTNTDTEVIVYLYQHYGPNFLKLLDGMFAFCIYDKTDQSYFLARDRFGEKPLFYHHSDALFSFSSEINSLLKNDQIPRVLNHQMLPYYFSTSLVPGPYTLFENILSLPPGHSMRIGSSGVQINQYFNPTYSLTPIIKNLAQAKELVEPLLRNAIKKQMVSDVPIGAFLSGGIDSSTVVALMSQQSDRKISTFNVKFEDEAYDESRIAKKVAEYCETDHHQIIIPNIDFSEEIFWEIIDHTGIPFRDSSAIPTYFITKEIRQHVKVALSGDGGDELFGGYSQFAWFQQIRALKKIPSWARFVMYHGLNSSAIFPGLSNWPLLRKGKRVVKSAGLDERELIVSLQEMFGKEDTPFQGSMDELFNFPGDWESWSPIRKIMYYRLINTLPENMLVKVDRMSMASSLEVRAPFLDHHLFEATTQLDDDLLMKNGLGKILIREIMKEHLPNEVFSHPKKGFNIPLFKYQNETYIALAKRLLFEENPWPDLIDKINLMRIFNNGIHATAQQSHLSAFRAAHQLWMCMMLFGWAKHFDVQQN